MAAFSRRATLILLAASVALPARAAASKRQEFAYGPKRDQRLDVYIQPDLAQAPVLVFVHGGAWERGDKTRVNDLPDYAARNGLLFISIGYRLSPDVDAGGSAQDVADAMAWVRDNAAKYGGDPGKIFLMGHSAGAHLAALIGVDPTYLAKSNMAPKDLSGVILLDGAGYVAKQEMQWFDAGRSPVAHMFHEAFDRDPDGLSPALVVKPGIAYPPFIIFFIDKRADSPPQARELAAGLRRAGAKFAIRVVHGETHSEINQDFGRKGDAEGDMTLTFIRTGVLPPNDLPPPGETPRRGGGNASSGAGPNQGRAAGGEDWERARGRLRR